MFVPLPFPSASYRAVSFCVPADQPNGRRHRCRAGQASNSEDQRTPWMRVHPGQQYPEPSFWWIPWVANCPLSSLSTQKAVTMQLSVFMRLSLLVGHPDLCILFLLYPVHPILLWPSALAGPQRVSAVTDGLYLGRLP